MTISKHYSVYDLLHYMHRQHPTGNCAYGVCPACGRQSVDAKVCVDCLCAELEARGASHDALAILRSAHQRHQNSSKQLKDCEDVVAECIYSLAMPIAEQQAYDQARLKRMGVEGAQNFSAGDVGGRIT